MLVQEDLPTLEEVRHMLAEEVLPTMQEDLQLEWQVEQALQAEQACQVQLA